MTPSLEREILVDLLHNRGATAFQIKHRFHGHAPTQVHCSLSQLITVGKIACIGERLEITRDGMKSLYREVRV